MVSTNSARYLLPSFLDLVRGVSAGKCCAVFVAGGGSGALFSTRKWECCGNELRFYVMFDATSGSIGGGQGGALPAPAVCSSYQELLSLVPRTSLKPVIPGRAAPQTDICCAWRSKGSPTHARALTETDKASAGKPMTASRR